MSETSKSFVLVKKKKKNKSLEPSLANIDKLKVCSILKNNGEKSEVCKWSYI